MIRTAVFAGALALGLGIAGSSLPALAVTGTQALPQTTQHVTLATSLEPQYGVGRYDGTLVLTISPDGIVNGTYRPWGEGNFRTVTGGTDGSRIWLDIGYLGRLHIEGTYANGKIVGSTFIADQPFTFSAAPTT